METSPSSSTPDPIRPKRRPRYSGKNPRQFHQKYKEHQPDKYPETIQKVLLSGKTPAGSHRPVMVREILEILNPKPGNIGVDATLGFGGHTSEMLPRILPTGKLIALDQDPIELQRTVKRLREQGLDSDHLIVEQANYAGLPQVLSKQSVTHIDFLLADLGCSSMQLDDPGRGFSFKIDGPLDMRMNPNKGRPASALLQSVEQETLERLLEENADEPHAGRIAAALIEHRKMKPIQTTLALAEVISGSLGNRNGQPPSQEHESSIRRVFQALRIAVNEEFSNLDRFLKVLPDCLKPGGKVVILSFHSGEDRRVKKAFQNGLRDGLYSSFSQEVIRPTPDEIRSNPRSSSTKLRWAIRAVT